MPLDKRFKYSIVMRVSKTNLPTLRLPISNYAEMRRMRNSQLVCVLRSAVLAPEKVRRFRPEPPADYDAYRVRITADNISVDLMRDGSAVFRCMFEEAGEY